MATESFFSNASLAYLASAGAGKDGKTYSIKPTDGSGDFTFSRGSNLAATRVGPTGLIEKGRENLFAYSNDFSQWVSINTTETGGQTGYDGSSDAWLLTKTNANGRIYQSISSSGVRSISIYAKAGTLDWVRLQVIDAINNPNVFFDLQNGVIGVNAGANYVDSSIESIGTDGWYRLRITFDKAITLFNIYPAEGDEDTSGTSGSIYIQDAQLEQGLAATDYIESGATTGKAGLLEDEPRFDYSGGATCPSLLLEPSRTNVWKYSEYLEYSFASVTNITTTQNTTETLSPEGLYNATKLEGVSTWGLRDFITGTNTGTYTISCWVKAVNASSNNTFRLSVGGNNFSSNLTATSEWQRFDFSVTDGGATAAGISRDSSANDADLYIYGMQIEEGSYPTSYIPNHSGGSVTRGLDAMNNSSLGLTDCTFFVDFVPLSSVMGLLDFYDNSNAMIFYIAINSVKYLQFNGVQGGTIGSVLGPLTIGDRYKLAFTLNASTGDVTIFVNGTKYGTYSTTISSLNKIFQVSSFGYYNNTEFNQILTFGEILSDADCITLTT